ncbi:hypothetical protein [Leptospira santarosai]|uniref:hypothetical protein n=1 Tax=Leptospira santarosai TaxID=28183 RepID=UPI00062CFDD3|nr:hypothetical protein [Leptospira santarosai]AVV51764.1 Uncharacterized protein XB17_03192 [Leptospira santarosai]MDI7164803.1 hypothetical protein [Leptospira santarosai]MDI7215984.1 hypothetical protein [Leptospira santarosai]MDI7216013.1 hypothetical protein [Leptospira santarosai]
MNIFQGGSFRLKSKRPGLFRASANASGRIRPLRALHIPAAGSIQDLKNDSKPIETLRIFWPVLIIIVYWIAPNSVPGPVDDSIVTLGVGIYQVYRYFKERNAEVPTESEVKQ